jgi:uncharacterized protein (DUF924 family)
LAQAGVWRLFTKNDIIRRFGPFLHQNAALGRATTAAEQAFLDGSGFAR